jgi:hypothetical protein
MSLIHAAKHFLIQFIERSGVGITSAQDMRELRNLRLTADDNARQVLTGSANLQLALELVAKKVLFPENFQDLLTLFASSKSQCRQDLFCMIANDWKRKGFFVEFGAVDGVDGSNTFSLEKKFDWNGVLAEPNPTYHSVLKQNRSCRISQAAIGRDRREAREFIMNGNLGTFAQYKNDDGLDRSKG